MAAAAAAAAVVKMIALVVVLLSVVAVNRAEGASHHAPAPAVDCSSLILNMADCLSFVSNGSVVTTPEGTCCNGLKTVLKADANCLCEAFKSSAQLGVVLNVTKALSLPSACKVSASSAANCACLFSLPSSPSFLYIFFSLSFFSPINLERKVFVFLIDLFFFSPSSVKCCKNQKGFDF